MRRITATLCLLLIVVLTGYCQNNMQLKVVVDGALIENTTKRLTVKFKFKDKKDTLKIVSGNGSILVPPLNGELVFFEVKFDSYSTGMTDYGAEVEGKNIFRESRTKKGMQIIIDTYPFSPLTVKRFPKIKKNQYSIIFTDYSTKTSEVQYGFFTGINTNN